MTDLHQLYGTQLDAALEAYEEAMEAMGRPCLPFRVGCELTDIMTEYYERLGLPMDGSNAIGVGQKLLPDNTVGPVIVTIRLDGYRVEFEHHPTFVVPPPECWEKV